MLYDVKPVIPGLVSLSVALIRGGACKESNRDEHKWERVGAEPACRFRAEMCADLCVLSAGFRSAPDAVEPQGKLQLRPPLFHLDHNPSQHRKLKLFLNRHVL